MDELKKVLLAGIGLTSMTYDKAQGLIKEMIEKGRLTVDEGKELQSELKRKSQAEAEQLIQEVKSKSQGVQYATKEDLSRLEDKLDQLLKQLSETTSSVDS